MTRVRCLQDKNSRVFAEIELTIVCSGQFSAKAASILRCHLDYRILGQMVSLGK